MANDVINPYQTFRDERGVALSGGSLKVYVNRTTTLGTAFSDSALTVPQNVDPYRLDAYGRVRGDLRWSGERSVDVFDRFGAFVRRLNDVVTLVDTSGFAINFPSVAAMAADPSLEAGDVCETQSYNVDQRQGGARYVVTSSSETVDGFLVIDLAPAGLQARLLDVEQNRNYYVAGAIGDGVADDSVPMQALLSLGGNIECANGTFRGASLSLATSARVHGDGRMILTQFSTTSLISLSGENVFIWFDGVTLDGDAANQGAESAASLVNSVVTATPGNVSIVSFTNVTFEDPTLYALAGDGADDGTSVLYSFGTCRFLGGLEATTTPYQPAYVLLTDGVNGALEDCYFDLETTPGADGGRGGVVTSNATFLNPGYLSVAACTFNRIGGGAQGVINAQGVKQLMVSENRILSPGVAGILWGAEVDAVMVNGNLVDGFGPSTVKLGQMVAVATTQVTPGNSWQLEDNQLLGSLAGALLLNGSSAGVDVADVSIIGNMIDAPTLQGILLESIDGLDIRDNTINMESIAAVNAFQVGAGGISGQVTVQDNTIRNVDGVALDASVGGVATMVVDGNTIESVTTGPGVDIRNVSSLELTNNSFESVATKLGNLDTIASAIVEGNTYLGAAPTSYITVNAITALAYSDNFLPELDASVVDIVSAATISASSAYHRLSGATAIDTINFPANIQGFVMVLGVSADTRTLNDLTGNLNLAGNFSLGPSDTITLVWNAGTWIEVSRSTN